MRKRLFSSLLFLWLVPLVSDRSYEITGECTILVKTGQEVYLWSKSCEFYDIINDGGDFVHAKRNDKIVRNIEYADIKKSGYDASYKSDKDDAIFYRRLLGKFYKNCCVHGFKYLDNGDMKEIFIEVKVY